MAEGEANAYVLLELEMDVDEPAIRKAYRQRSLKVHPDRNPNNPNAARRFHELNQAYELLLDPLRRLALDAKLRLKKARTERFKSYDNKRKVLVEELEERERAFKKQRVEKQQEELKRYHDTEQIKDKGRRLREEKEKELRQRELEREIRSDQPQTRDEHEPPSIESTDTTVRVKFTLSDRPELTTKEALSTLLSPFGPMDAETIVLSLKAPKKAPHKAPKTGTALIPFKRIGDAFAAVCASGRAERGLKNIDISWVGSQEPAIIGWLKSTGKLSAQPTATSNPSPTIESVPFASFPSNFPESIPETNFMKTSPSATVQDVDYESLTLMRMRQAERERLEREIREQENEE